MIPIQYALRRRMMSKKSMHQWTLTVTPEGSTVIVSINGENLAAGTYVVDDGTVAHFVANGSIFNTITLDGTTVANAGNGKEAQYDLEIHANYTATSSYTPKLSAKWVITTQQ